MKKKKILVFSDPSDSYSLEMVKLLEKSKLFNIFMIITSKKEKKNIWRLKKIVKNKNINIYCDSFPHKNKKIINRSIKQNIKLGISTGFSNLIGIKFLKIFKEGIINIHPAYLPYNKGSHSAFWSILNEEPYGSSLHYMDRKFDSGKIIDRVKVENNLFKTAEEIYHHSRKLGIKLLKKNLGKIYSGKITTIKNEKSKINFKKDIKKIIYLKLNQEIKVKKLWAIIRGTKFENHGIFFNIKNKRFKIVSTIEEV